MISTFISSTFNDNSITVTIDGSASNAEKTDFGCEGKAVQLRRARTEESEFNWDDFRIKSVIAKNILVYDGVDVNCLCWFISRNIKLDLSQSFISPLALDALQCGFEPLKRLGVKVVEGSSIPVPMMQGFSGIGRASAFSSACQEIGFKTNGSFF